MIKITEFLVRLFFKDTASASIQPVIEKSFRVLFLQFAAVLFVFAGNVLIARFYGETIYGLYSHVFNWISILTIFAQAGMDDYHIAVIPALHLQNDYPAIRKVLKYSVTAISVASVLIVVFFNTIITIFPIAGLTENRMVFFAGLWMIILFALSSNFSSFLRGYGVIVKSQLAEKIIRPLLFLMFLIVFYTAYPAWRDVYLLFVLTAISLFAGFLFLIVLIKRSVTHENNSQLSSVAEINFRRTRFFLALSVLYLLTSRLDILVLGSLSSVTDVGHYNVALKMSEIISYPIVIMNIVIPTFLSRQHFLENRRELFRLIQNGSRVTLIASVFIFVIALVAGKWLMGLYGDNFEVAFIPMVILCCAHLVTAFAGPVAIYFVVSGREKQATFCMLANVFVTGILCFLLIPLMGIKGAAIASMSGSLVFTLSIVYLFYKREKVLITPFTIIGQH